MLVADKPRKLLVDLDWLATVKLRLKEIDNTPLEDIEWCRPNKHQKVEQPSDEQIEQWEFLGLRNSDFPDFWHTLHGLDNL